MESPCGATVVTVAVVLPALEIERIFAIGRLIDLGAYARNLGFRLA